jgi:phosphonate transport system ATP-binding protein
MVRLFFKRQYTPMTTLVPPLLRCAEVAVTYPDGTRALLPNRFDIRCGELVALLGQSGAGKSTLLRAMNGLVPLSQGHIELGGFGLVSNRLGWRRLRREVAMVFQQHQLIGRCTALANVLTGRLSYHSSIRTLLPFARADRLIAMEALERVGLAQHALKRCDQLSGGQQQRVGIARALAQNPRLLLADEPVASLDPNTAAEVLALIRQVCESAGIGAVVSLHQVDLAKRFGTRILGISAGRIQIDAPAAQVDDSQLILLYGARAAPRLETGQQAPDSCSSAEALAA